MKLEDLTIEQFNDMVQQYHRENQRVATHLFLYSRGQDEMVGNPVYFKGQRYSEMKGFGFGMQSNWEDMVILGVGTIEDVEH